MISRDLDSLDRNFRPLAVELLARLVEARIIVLIVNTRRTPYEQQQLIAQGRSWTENSKHLHGLAIDVAPFEIYFLYGMDKLEWDADAPVWQPIGRIGERVGLVWGGRWGKKDMGHFEAPGGFQ